MDTTASPPVAVAVADSSRSLPSDPDLSADDLALVDRLEAGTLDGFSHRNHVRAAWVLLRRHGLAVGATHFVDALRRFAEAHREPGTPGLYHETMTWTFLLAIEERIGRMEAAAADSMVGRGWESFEAAHPQLLTDGRGFLERYYRPETLDGDLARRCFVLPDRCSSGVVA